jgi:glycogen operon protein
MTEQDWAFPDGRFLSYVLSSNETDGNPLFIVLNAAPEGIPFKLPKLTEYKSWRQVLNTADDKLSIAILPPGADVDAPPRSVLAFAGTPA